MQSAVCTMNHEEALFLYSGKQLLPYIYCCNRWLLTSFVYVFARSKPNRSVVAFAVAICGWWASLHMQWGLHTTLFSNITHFFCSIFLTWVVLLHFRRIGDGNKKLLPSSFPLLTSIYNCIYQLEYCSCPDHWIGRKCSLIDDRREQKSGFSYMEAQVVQHWECTQVCGFAQSSSPQFVTMAVGC